MNAIPARPPTPGADDDRDGAAVEGEIRAAVEHVIRQILPEFQGRDIPEDKHLRDLGADSIDRVEIILTLIDRLKLADSMSSFADIPNIGEMILYLEERAAHDRQ